MRHEYLQLNKVTYGAHLVVSQAGFECTRQFRSVDGIETPCTDDLDASSLHLFEGCLNILLGGEERKPLEVVRSRGRAQ